MKLFQMQRYITEFELYQVTTEEHQVVDRWDADEISVFVNIVFETFIICTPNIT